MKKEHISDALNIRVSAKVAVGSNGELLQPACVWR